MGYLKNLKIGEPQIAKATHCVKCDGPILVAAKTVSKVCRNESSIGPIMSPN